MAGAAFFELTANGDVQVARRLERFAARAEDASPLWHAITDYLQRIEQVQFQSEGKFSGGWYPLAPSTVAAKGHDRILYLTGRLWESLTGGNGDSIRVIEEDFMAFGTTVPYAGVHQHGTLRQGVGDGSIPQRRPVELSEGQRKSIAKRCQRWIVTGDVLAVGAVR